MSGDHCERMSFHLDTLFCDESLVDLDDHQNLQNQNNQPEQTLPDNHNNIKLMVVDEETVANLTQCTVCFGSEADLELMNCGDQLCFSCLEQYSQSCIVTIYMI